MVRNEKLSFSMSSFQKMNQLRKDNILVDIVIHNEGLDCVAHKIVLASACCFFREIFVKDNKIEHIRLNFSCQEIENILDYMYTGEYDITDVNVESVIIIAKYLKMKALLYDCYIYIMNRGKDFELYRLISEYDINVSHEEILSEICVNPSWVNLPSIHRFVFNLVPFGRFIELLESNAFQGKRYGLILLITEWTLLAYEERISHSAELFSKVKLNECEVDDMLANKDIDTGYDDLNDQLKFIHVQIATHADEGTIQLAREYGISTIPQFSFSIDTQTEE